MTNIETNNEMPNASHIQTLLDWLKEVWEVYRLHKKTFYLAKDFIDHFLSVAPPKPKNRLQLVGITCLFMSTRIEESFPPRLEELAYITAGACTVEEIQQLEIIISRGLNSRRI